MRIIIDLETMGLNTPPSSGSISPLMSGIMIHGIGQIIDDPKYWMKEQDPNIWTSQDKKKWPINSLEDDHLRNCAAMLEKKYIKEYGPEPKTGDFPIQYWSLLAEIKNRKLIFKSLLEDSE